MAADLTRAGHTWDLERRRGEHQGLAHLGVCAPPRLGAGWAGAIHCRRDTGHIRWDSELATGLW